MSGGNSYFNLGFSGPTLWPLFGNIFSGGGNYETGFTDWVLAWSPEVEEWQVVGNMLAARYVVYLATCWQPGTSGVSAGTYPSQSVNWSVGSHTNCC